MATNRDGPAQVLRLLVAYRLLFYLGALIALSLPLGLAWLFDVHLQPATRSSVVAVSLGVILATYLSERQVGLDHVDPRTGAATESYPLRMRVSVVFAIVGVAASVYFLLSARPGVGLLFLLGAVLFVQLATRSADAEEV